jgi:Alg9-like mannosyltransferase family
MSSRDFDWVRHLSFTSVIFLSILSFRLVNALAIRAFFQPDEFFQSLEPAWELVFGGGWVTWVFLCLCFPACIDEWMLMGENFRNGEIS